MSDGPAWITGAAGLIGRHLVGSASTFASSRHIVPIERERLDLLDFGAVTHAFKTQQPGAIIHCAALSRVADCEADPVLAARLNVDVTRLLCQLAENIPFIFFSTDVVFDGRKGGYVESDAINPLSVYAETKARAEQVVLQNPRHTVVRTSLNTGVSSTGDRSFTEQMRQAWERGETLNLFVDEYRCPIPAVVTARAIWELLDREATGIYHLAGSERLSRWEVGQLLAKRWPQLVARMKAVSVKDYRGPARSPDTSLNCAMFQALLSFPLPRLGQWLVENPGEPV